MTDLAAKDCSEGFAIGHRQGNGLWSVLAGRKGEGSRTCCEKQLCVGSERIVREVGLSAGTQVSVRTRERREHLKGR